MNKFNFLFLFISALCLGPHTFAQKEVCIDGIYYNLNSSDKTAEVTRQRRYNYKEKKNIVIPSSFHYSNEKYKVTSIGDEAFFGCDSLVSITLPKSITRIGDGAFFWCRNLTSITIPNSATYIGNRAFLNCQNLSTITIPKSVTTIGNEAFSCCGSLGNIKVNKKNRVYTSVDGVLYTKDMSTLVNYPYAKTGDSFIIPPSVTNIADYAFESYSNLRTITIPASVSNIGALGFPAYSKILVEETNETYTSVNGVLYTKDMSKLVKYPSNLEEGYVSIPNSVTHIGDYAFHSCLLDSLVIPNSVTTIGIGSFSMCHLISITIPHSITRIENETFMQCQALSSIDIPKSVTSIGENAFACCFSLSSINIPNSVTSIENRAFSYCYKLTSITIPHSVTHIGEWILEHCKNLTSVYLDNTHDFTEVDLIGGLGSNDKCVLYVPSQLKEKYEKSRCGRSFSKIVGMDFAH